MKQKQTNWNRAQNKQGKNELQENTRNKLNQRHRPARKQD